MDTSLSVPGDGQRYLTQMLQPNDQQMRFTFFAVAIALANSTLWGADELTPPKPIECKITLSFDESSVNLNCTPGTPVPLVTALLEPLPGISGKNATVTFSSANGFKPGESQHLLIDLSESGTRLGVSPGFPYAALDLLMDSLTSKGYALNATLDSASSLTNPGRLGQSLPSAPKHNHNHGG